MEIIFIILLLCLTVYSFSQSQKRKNEILDKDKVIFDQTLLIEKYSIELSNLNVDKKALIEKVNFLKSYNQDLIQYQEIIDIKKECERLISIAESDCFNLREKAHFELYNAQLDAKDVRRNVKDFSERKIIEIDLLMKNALEESERILLNAESKAESIGGDAYKSLKEAENLTDIVNAMKNVISGYGNEYLIPTYTILDELADDFAHKEAGDKLKQLRKSNKMLIVNRHAAECDYVDKERRNIAIDFVIDAYNGKVDSILSGVKKDNLGILKQKINDAFRLVNYNGKAFRNARILTHYHEARLEELKWAVIAQELKWKEQEEQKRIREEIREEEKARREYEKALKEAEKEELTLKKLIEKAQMQVEKANAEQRILFEQQLQELNEKLLLAEEKNSRALSMAQQTKRGNVYIISNIGSFGEDIFKIGMTRRLEPMDRVKELGDASVPFEFDVHAMIYSDDAPNLERQLHKKFLKNQLNKINPRKEFFRLDLVSIKTYLDELEIPCKWTMKAEARQYYETLKLEEEMRFNKELENEWEDYQEAIENIPHESFIED